MRIIAKTFEGLETVLAKEIRSLGGEEMEILKRAVSFEGDRKLLYKANYMLRTALRLLVFKKEFEAKNEEHLYHIIKSIPWESIIRKGDTIAIDYTANSNVFRHSKFMALKSKDAICDRMREKYGWRPDVNVINPTYRINLHVRDVTFTLSLDSSGKSLHYRGYRINSVDAPLNEVMAAGLIAITGWQGETPFLDPMCGSGTLLIEAARLATNSPAQSKDFEFGFKKWKSYDEDLFQTIVQEAAEGIKPIEHPVLGYDKSLAAVRASQINVQEAGLSEAITVEKKDFFRTSGNQPYTIVINPPYDERLRIDDINAFYKSIGHTLYNQYKGSEAWVFSGNLDAIKSVGLKTSEKYKLLNGPLPASFYSYEIFDHE